MQSAAHSKYNRQIRKQEKELERSYHSTLMMFVNKGDSIEKSSA